MGLASIFKKYCSFLLPLLLLILFSFLFFHGKMNLFPHHFHAWTQSDRLALAHGYTENNMALLLPSTANLRPTYPPEKPLAHLNGITKADVPLPEFIVAALMMLSDSRSPAIFRFTVLIIGIAGLLFFDVILRKAGSTPLISAFIMLALMFTPVLSYYLNGFLPAVTGLSLSFAALYAYVMFLRNQKRKLYLLSLIIFTVAVLIRPPFLMPMTAMIMVQSWHDFKQHTLVKVHFLAVAGVLVIIPGFYLYNNWIESTYGSLFISSLMPAANFSEFGSLVLTSWQNWKFDYMSPLHYFLLLIAVMVILFNRKTHKDSIANRLLSIAVLCFLASLIYLFAMARQFPDHDYYFIESFLLPIALITGLGFSQVKFRKPVFNYIFIAIALPMIAWMFVHSKNVMAERNTIHSWNMPAKSYLMFEGSADWLDEQEIDPEAKMLVLDAYTTNIPLLLMERKGYTVLNTTQQNILESLNWDYDYVVIPNSSLFGDILLNEPQLLQKITAVANNGRIGLYQQTDSSNALEIKSLLLPDTLINLQKWDLVKLDSSVVFFPLLDTLFENSNALTNIYFESHFENMSLPVNGFHLVTDVQGSNDYHHYDVYPLNRFFENNNAENLLRVLSVLPKDMPQNVRIKYYLWNPGKNNIILKNQTLCITKYYNT